MAAVGFLYLILIAPKLLKDRASLAGTYILESGKQFLVQAEVTKGSFLDGMSSVAGMFPELKEMTIRLIQRKEEQFLPPFDDIKLKPGDRLVIAATRPVLTDILKKFPGLLSGIIEESPDEMDDPNEFRKNQVLAEVMVAPASRMHGLSLVQVGFYGTTGCIVLGIQRRSRMLRSNLNRTRLEPGDVLLVMGQRADIMALRANKDVVLLEYSAKDLPLAKHSKSSKLVFGAVVVAAALGFPIAISALFGASFMIGYGCLNIRQAGRAVDRRIVLLIGAAIAMGSALSATGGAEFLASQMILLTHGESPLIILSVFFLMVALITNVLSNNATAVLFTPVAVSVATGIGVDPKIFVIAVVLAANCSFASPIGYQTNLLVMAPGHYKFSDFTKVGSILIVLMWITFTAFAAWYYNLG
jgi:di/tricarboxylate transporter